MIPIGTQNAARAAAKRRKSLEKKGVLRVNFDDLRVSSLPPLALCRSVLVVVVQGSLFSFIILIGFFLG